MVDSLPRRPGFSTGVEDPVWEGRPALRATLYLWLISGIFGGLLNYFWQHFLLDPGIMQVFADYGLLAHIFTPTPDGLKMKLWLASFPWVIALFPVFWYTLSLAVTSYALTTQRLTIKTGIFFRTFDQLELFRVRDFLIDAPLYYTLLGIGHVRIISRDETLPLLTLIAQTSPHELVNIVRTKVQIRKDEVGTREIETNTA